MCLVSLLFVRMCVGGGGRGSSDAQQELEMARQAYALRLQYLAQVSAFPVHYPQFTSQSPGGIASSSKGADAMDAGAADPKVEGCTLPLWGTVPQLRLTEAEPCSCIQWHRALGME